MQSSVRDADVIRELKDLMSVKGQAPRDVESCIELTQFVAEMLPQLSKNATTVAWLLVVSAVKLDEPGTSQLKPLLAARHLLALGTYPDDVHRDCGQTLDEIMLADPPSSNSDPASGITLRRKIAARAGGYGGSPSNLQPNHRGRKLHRVARALWEAIKQQAANPSVVGDLEGALGSERARADSSRDVALRRLRRISRRRLLSRVGRYSVTHARGLAVTALLLFLLVVLVDAYVYFENPENTHSIDPLVAQRAGESWSPRAGPTNATRAANSSSGLTLNPRVERNVMLYWLGPIEGNNYLTIDGNFDDSEGYQELVPGDYVVSYRVLVERTGHSTWTGVNTSGAQLQFGILPARGVAASHALFARLSADGTSDVWEGEPLVVLCNCTIELVADSLLLFSDELPDGVSLNGDGVNSPALIGYEGPDGVLHSGVSNVVKVTATVRVRERDW